MTGLERPNLYQWAVDGPPIGEWVTADANGFMAVMSSTLTLRADGTGLQVDHSALFGPSSIAFLWRFERPGDLRLRRLYEDDAEAEDEPHWEVVRYRVGWLLPDESGGPVLVNEPGGIYPGVFWDLPGPLSFVRAA